MPETIMAEKNLNNVTDRIPSACITDNKTGTKYELDFNRDSIRFAESHQFKLNDVVEYPQTGIYDIFYYAFRMHHRNVARNFTDSFIERMGGVPESLLKRLMELYAQAQASNAIQSDEEASKNPEITVEL